MKYGFFFGVATLVLGCSGKVSSAPSANDADADASAGASSGTSTQDSDGGESAEADAGTETLDAGSSAEASSSEDAALPPPAPTVCEPADGGIYGSTVIGYCDRDNPFGAPFDPASCGLTVDTCDHYCSRFYGRCVPADNGQVACDCQEL